MSKSVGKSLHLHLSIYFVKDGGKLMEYMHEMDEIFVGLSTVYYFISTIHPIFYKYLTYYDYMTYMKK